MQTTAENANDIIRRGVKSATVIFWLIITIVPILGVVFSIVNPLSFYATQESWRLFAQRYGTIGPLVFVGVQVLQVVVTPISHYGVGLMGGFLYGPWLGALYNWIGRVIGHLCAYWISRLLGRRVAKRFVSPRALQVYDHYVSDKSLMLFLIYFLPLFPDDEISYLVGLSRMQFRWFLLANLFGHVGGALSLAYLGNGINTKDPIFWVLTIVTLAGFPALWLLHKQKTKQTTTSSL